MFAGWLKGWQMHNEEDFPLNDWPFQLEAIAKNAFDPIVNVDSFQMPFKEMLVK